MDTTWPIKLGTKTTYTSSEVVRDDRPGHMDNKRVVRVQEVETRPLPSAQTSNSASQPCSSGWSPLAIGAAACVAAYTLPFVAAGVATAAGYGALAASATLISNNLADNNRKMRESDNEVMRHEKTVDGEVRRYEMDVKAGVVHRLIDDGHLPGNGDNNARYLGPYSVGLIED